MPASTDPMAVTALDRRLLLNRAIWKSPREFADYNICTMQTYGGFYATAPEPQDTQASVAWRLALEM